MVVQLFLLCCTGKEKAGQKENRMETGLFENKLQKANALLLEIIAKIPM